MDDYYQIKDNCRKGLIKYLEKAISIIPGIDNPDILDIGCGTGVPTLWIAERFSGNITAVDVDKDSLDYFSKKILNRNLNDKITTLCTSFFDFNPGTDLYDIILAEGFLNAVGFERGFKRATGILKKGGYFIIHDEYKDHEKKCNFIRENSCKVMNTLYLDETVWWNDYYRQLEIEISRTADAGLREMFNSDLNEIEQYKADPHLFRSCYYVVEKM